MKRKRFKIISVVIFYIVAGFMLAYYVTPKDHMDIPAAALATVSLSGEFITGDVHGGEDQDSEIPDQPDEESEEDYEEEKEYVFVSTNKITVLYVRNEPSLSGKIIGRLAPGTKGDVLERGEEWSLITDGNTKGYSYNEYLDIQEKE